MRRDYMQASPLAACPQFKTFDPMYARLKKRFPCSRALDRAEQVSDEIWLEVDWVDDRAKECQSWASLVVDELPVYLGFRRSTSTAELYDERTRKLPRGIREAVAGAVLQPVIDAVAHFARAKAVLNEWPVSVATLAPCALVLCRGVEGGRDDSDRFVVAVHEQKYLDRLSVNAPQGRAIGLPEFIQLPVSVEFGRSRLPYNKFKQTEIGDVVLLARHYSRLPVFQPALVVAGRVCARGAVISTNFKISDINRLDGDLAMPEISPPPANDATALAALEVPLTAVCSTYSVSAKEIATWQPGTIVPLGIPVDGDRITLMVGQQSVARGRLVGVGEQLGVEILDLYCR